jgi:putative redox protein
MVHAMKDIPSPYRIELTSVAGGPTAVAWGGTATVVVDRPIEAGGRGLGFNGGQLLNLAVAGCVSNDLYREAADRGIALTHVKVTAVSDYAGSPATSSPIDYRVELAGEASEEALDDLLRHVDAIAEIPNSIRRGTEVRLVR